MLMRSVITSTQLMYRSCINCRVNALVRKSPRWYSDGVENKYSIDEKETILRVINESDVNTLSMYDLTKARLRKFSQWKSNKGHAATLTDVEVIEGFTEKTAKKLFDSILKGPQKAANISSKIKGQILHPHLSEAVIKSCKTVLSVYVSVNSVCWTLIDKSNYEVLQWEYSAIHYPDGKKLQITDILDIAWRITHLLPMADIYVMKAEATTLRAAGSDPNNPKVLAVNLQKAQMIAMIVALINARANSVEDEQTTNEMKQSVYFLRPSLPFRLYGTLVGNEEVATDQTVDILLNNLSENPSTNHVKVPDHLRNMFRNQKDLQKDMLGHCFLLCLTFMDLCIYRDQDRINSLVKRER